MTDERGELLWQPTPEAMSSTSMGRFASAHGFTDYHALYDWSVRDLDGFWRAVTEYTGVRWRRPSNGGRAVVDRTMPGTTWFPGSELNYGEHALSAAPTRHDDIAVVAHSQTRPSTTLTWGQLADAVRRCAAGLRRLGVARGDRVVAYLPNIPETTIAFLATASIGAVWSSCAPEFGTRAVIDRFGQIEPTVLLAVDGYRYGTKVIDRRAEVDALVASLPTVRHLVRIPYLGSDSSWDDWGALTTATPEPLSFEAVPFAHPLYVLFSSGTTGVPKAIVHGHGGIVVEHLKVLGLHHDLGPTDRFFWFTTTGWMMWNYLMSGLLVGASIVLFDGDPGYPDLSTLWDLAEANSITAFGVSATMLMACRRAGIEPRRGAMRWVGSTGAPLPASGYRWVTDRLSVPVHSISGGTDVCSAFLGAAPLVPVRAGEISCRLLGCGVEAFDPDGRPCPPGTTGELVLTTPMPSMPSGFWGDDGTRLQSSYFDTYPGVWRHGDWITFTEDGSSVVSGRSDATLNRGGVRLGTTDFYSVVEEQPEVADSLVVHLEDEAREGLGQLLLFIVLVPGAVLSEDLRARINGALRTELSPRHVPDRIEVVAALPRTLSGKRLEIPVKRILKGTPAEQVTSLDSINDADALRQFEALRSIASGG